MMTFEKITATSSPTVRRKMPRIAGHTSAAKAKGAIATSRKDQRRPDHELDEDQQSAHERHQPQQRGGYDEKPRPTHRLTWAFPVGREGLEPPTPCASCKCANQLRQRPGAASVADGQRPGARYGPYSDRSRSAR